MAGAKKRGFTPAELAMIETGQPDLWAAMKAGEGYAAESARGWLNSMKRRKASAKAQGQTVEVEPPGGEDAPAPTPEPAPPPAVAVQLPLWPEPLRATPNGVLRSALFGATTHRGGRMVYRENIEALAGIEITYTGPRLNQGDLDAWEAILHTLRGQGMGRECRTTTYHLLKVMGLSNNGQNQKALASKIARLNASAVEIQFGDYLYMGSLLDRAARDKKTQEWVIVLNPDLIKLFAPDQFTLIQWGVRRKLAAKPLAQWLHGFYSSHAKPYPLRLETLRRLCGSEAGELKTFTQKLKKALEAMQRASAAAGEGFAWKIEGGLLYVKRAPVAALDKGKK